MLGIFAPDVNGDGRAAPCPSPELIIVTDATRLERRDRLGGLVHEYRLAA
jgi:hypothetical protein